MGVYLSNIMVWMIIPKDKCFMLILINKKILTRSRVVKIGDGRYHLSNESDVNPILDSSDIVKYQIDGVDSDVFHVSLSGKTEVQYILNNIPFSSSISIQNKGLENSLVMEPNNSSPITIEVNGGSTTAYSDGNYYQFSVDGKSVDLTSYAFMFMRGKT